MEAERSMLAEAYLSSLRVHLGLRLESLDGQASDMCFG